MKKRYVDLPKGDISLLSKDEKKELAAMADSPGLMLLSRISEDFVTKTMEMAVQSQDADEKLKYLDAAFHMRNSLAFLLDAPHRAKEDIATAVDTEE